MGHFSLEFCDYVIKFLAYAFAVSILHLSYLDVCFNEFFRFDISLVFAFNAHTNYHMHDAESRWCYYFYNDIVVATRIRALAALS